MALNSPITIDVSEATAKAETMRTMFAEDTVQKITYKALGAAAKKVASYVGKASAQYYVTTQAKARAAVQPYQLEYGRVKGADVMATCTIPLRGIRGVAGKDFKASGGLKHVKRGTKQKLYVKVLRSGRSALPQNLNNSQSDQPPFRSRKSGLILVRKRKGRDSPVVRVVALAAPQFPANLAEGDVRRMIIERMTDRIDYYMGLELRGHK